MSRRAGGLAWGASAALVADPVIALVDAAVAGRLGLTPQAALAVGAAGVTSAAWLLNPLLFAQTSEVARAWGAGDRGAAARAVRSGTVAAVMAGVAVALLLVLVVGPLLLAVVDGAVASQARAYLHIRAAGLPVLAFVLAGHGALRGRGDTRGSAVIALSAAALHAVGAAAVLAWGLGLSGLAVVGIVAQAVAALAVVARLRAGGLLQAGSDSQGKKVALAEGWVVLRRAGPLALRGAALGVSTAALTAAAASMGTAQAAAHLVTYQVWLLVALALEGWKAAAQIIVAQDSHSRTEHLHADVRSLERGAVLLGVLAGLGMLATTAVLPELLAADGASAAAARQIWLAASLALVFGSIAFTRDGVEFGLRRYRANTRRTLRGCLVWLLAAALGAVSGQLVLLWALFVLGLFVRIPGPASNGASRGAVARTGSRWFPAHREGHDEA